MTPQASGLPGMDSDLISAGAALRQADPPPRSAQADEPEIVTAAYRMFVVVADRLRAGAVAS